MSRRYAILAAIGLIAGPVNAQSLAPISLVPGEAVTVRIDDGGRAGAAERGRAEWSRFDAYAARQLASLPTPDTPVSEGMPIDAPENLRPDPIPEGEVRVRFMTIADRHALLVVENGRDGPWPIAHG